MIDEDAQGTVGEASQTIDQRSGEASEDGGDDAGALLGLETPITEKAGFISPMAGDSNGLNPIFPLLGTKSLKSLSKSSKRRSTQRVCYDSLLRFGAHSSDLTSGISVKNGPRGCYGFIKNRVDHPLPQFLRLRLRLRHHHIG